VTVIISLIVREGLDRVINPIIDLIIINIINLIGIAVAN